MVADLHADGAVGLGMRQLDHAPSPEPVQRVQGGVEPEPLEPGVHPVAEVRSLNWNPASSTSRQLKDGGVGREVVVPHHAGEALQGSDRTE